MNLEIPWLSSDLKNVKSNNSQNIGIIKKIIPFGMSRFKFYVLELIRDHFIDNPQTIFNQSNLSLIGKCSIRLIATIYKFFKNKGFLPVEKVTLENFKIAFYIFWKEYIESLERNAIECGRYATKLEKEF